MAKHFFSYIAGAFSQAAKALGLIAACALAGFVLTIGVCLIIVLYVPGSGVISSEVQINALISLCFFVSILMVANLWKNKRDRQKSPLDEVDWLDKVNRYKKNDVTD